MIYSKFGSKLTLVTKIEGESGKVSVQATTGGTADMHDYPIVDLKADGGLPEINEAVAKLPLKVFENTSGRRRKPF
jgi:predicted Rdx family selenoprotein